MCVKSMLITDGETPSPVKAPVGKQRKMKRIMDSDDEAESPVMAKPETGTQHDISSMS